MHASTPRLALAAACLATVCVTASCGSDGSGASSADEHKRQIDLVVGDIVPLTGPLAGLGVSAQKAAQLAVEEANDAIGQADVDHSLEIVHLDSTDGGAVSAARDLLDSGAGCIIGPWSRRAMHAVASARGVAGKTLLISPQAPVARLPGPLGSRPVVGVPGLGPQQALSSEDRDPNRDDPSAAFARLYATTDPPIGPARTTDARQFDSVVLCYLAAVAAGSSASKRMAGRIVLPARRLERVAQGSPDRTEARSYSWLQLSDAIRALERRERIVYAGITTRVGIEPALEPAGMPQ